MESKKYKLHELFEMAKSGKKFEAFTKDVNADQSHFINLVSWHKDDITADWTVIFKPEPRVIRASERNGNIFYGYFTGDDSFERAKANGKPVKFIEVIE